MLMKIDFVFVCGTDSVLFPIPHYWSVFYLFFDYTYKNSSYYFFMAAKEKLQLLCDVCIM